MKSSSVVLIIDIQSNIIQGSLVDFTGGAETILYSTALPIAHKTHVTGAYITKIMIKGVEKLAVQIMNHAVPTLQAPVSAVHFVMSSPWVLSQSKTVNIHYEKPTEITESLVQKIIDEERTKIVKEYESEDMVFIEQKVFDVKLNGYSVLNYTGKKTNSLQMSFAFSLSSVEITKRIHEAVLHAFHVKKEFYHSSLLLQYAALRSVIGTDEDYMAFHVHGELTDMVIVKKGLCSSLASFPFGALTLVKKMSASMKITYEMSDSYLTLYEGGKLEKAQHEKVEKFVVGAIKEWNSECIKAFGADKAVPKKIYFSTEERHSGIFKNALKEKGFEVAPESHSLMELYTLALKGMI